jgi:hypothetical protein
MNRIQTNENFSLLCIQKRRTNERTNEQLGIIESCECLHKEQEEEEEDDEKSFYIFFVALK